jgi:hypothetical protein
MAVRAGLNRLRESRRDGDALGASEAGPVRTFPGRAIAEGISDWLARQQGRSEGPPRNREVAAKFGTSVGLVTGLLGSLEADGRIHRTGFRENDRGARRFGEGSVHIMKPRIPKNLPQPAPRERNGMSRAHLEMICRLPCLISGRRGTVQAHHLLRTGEHGIAFKSADKWAIPLDTIWHRALHNDGDEETFLARHGIDGRAVARALWAARGDANRMYWVVFKARQRAALKRRPEGDDGDLADTG